MSNDKMREEFEAWAACSAWLGLGEESQLHQDAEGTGYNEIEVHTAWLAWQASRAAVVVQFPTPMDGPEIDLADDDYEQFELHENTAIEVNAMRRECLRAVEAAGLKVKP